MPDGRTSSRNVRSLYLQVNARIWKHLPGSLTVSRFGSIYGAHLHRLIRHQSARMLLMGTFFFRNRPELDLLIRLLASKGRESTLDVTILGCSKGAEVYSFSYQIRQERPDLKVNLRALDIDPDVLEFAKDGVYSLQRRHPMQKSNSDSRVQPGDLASRTFGDQNTSVFERMSANEIDAMFECEGEQARVKQRFREGITWHLGDAGDQKLAEAFGRQDVVVANRFLCHMQPEQAEACLRSLSRLVKPGGYLFVSGVDLDVRSRVARELGWIPLSEMIEEIHEGDPSLRNDWPLQYWGLEPFDRRHKDWRIRYASVFRLGTVPSKTVTGEIIGQRTGRTAVSGSR
jgi:chemotaxis methyl-accepting protein methylase